MENNLPVGWQSAKLSQIVEHKKGKKPKRLESEPFQDSLTYLDIKAIEKNVNEIFADPGSSTITGTDELVIVWDGARAGWVGLSRVGAVGSTLMALRPKIDKLFLYRFLQSQFDYLHSNHRGTGIPHVDPDILWNIDVPIPPLNEQQRIVSKLNSLFEKIETNKKRLEKIPQILKRFRQSVLSAAINGKLTEDWRRKNYSITAVSLTDINKERERLQREHANKKGQKSFSYRKPVLIEIGDRTKGVEELFEIPDTWQWLSLDSCVWSVCDGPHFSPQYVSEDNGVAFISSRNITYRQIDFSDAKYVSSKDHKEFIKRGKPEVDDILLTKGGTTGIAHKIDTDIEFCIWVHVALLKVIKKYVDPKFLRDVLTSDFIYRQSQAQTHGVGNQDLGLTRMVFMTIPLPPLEEQKEIVKCIEELFSFADKVEARFLIAKAQLDKLPQSILAKAFRGELVTQDPEDEPANLLLERILSEK